MGTTLRSELIDLVEGNLQDPTNTFFDATVIGVVLDRCLREMAEHIPYEVKETVTTTDGSRDIDISAITDLKCIVDIEYRTGEWPREQRIPYKIFADILTLDVDFEPGDAENVYLYCHKFHSANESSNTLPDKEAEDLAVMLTAGRVIYEYANKLVNASNVFGIDAPKIFMARANAMVAGAKGLLIKREPITFYREHSQEELSTA